MKLGLVVLVVTMLTWAPAVRSHEGRTAADDGGRECLGKIMPCADYLKKEGTPPATCCIPLKQAMETQVACLCTLFYNQRLLSQFNVTRDEVRRFPTKCGAPAPDEALCRKAGVSPPPTSSTPVPTTPTPPTSKPPPTAADKSSSSSTDIRQSIMGVASVLASAGMMLYLNTF